MAHTIYTNEVLANKIEDLLTTHVDMNSYMTIDHSLSEAAGMQKTINTYAWSGDVEDLTMGNGNTKELTVAYTPKTYTVGVTQGKFKYYDEEEMIDPKVVEVGLRGLAEAMTNDLTAKAIAEFSGTNTLTQAIPSGGIDFATVVDAIAQYPYEDEAGLFMLINPAELADLRKNLADDLKYVEANVRTGYIGTVCGVPITVSKAVPAGEAYIATKDAVTCFVKKGSEIEQQRDADIRLNTVFARKVMLVALTDATKVIKLS